MGASTSSRNQRRQYGEYGPQPQYQYPATAPISHYHGQPPPPYQQYYGHHTAPLGPYPHPFHHHALPPGAPPNHYPASRPAAPPLTAPVSKSVHSGTTVRNLVNLKKHTLVVSPVDGAPHLLKVSFTFDASAPCCVSLFVMAKEEGRDGKLSSKATVGRRIAYDKGCGLTFPPEGLQDPELYCIDTAAFGVEQLHHANVSTHSYPLIVRLETLGDGDVDAVPAGTVLQEMELGCAQPEWLQSQTTYAVLGEEAGHDVVKVVRQKIWVNGNSYELQEIYGLMEATTGGGDGDTSTECVVCLTNPKNTTVLPCRHFCMCSECAKALLNQSRKCPICRVNITGVLQIDIGQSSKQPAAAAGGGKAATVIASGGGATPVQVEP